MTTLHYQNIIYIGLHHILAIYALQHLATHFSWIFLRDIIVFAWLSGLFGITAGAHRLWSHRSYKAALPVRIVFMLANCTAHQGSIVHWVRDHRLHHKFSDTEWDPHSIQKGFFYAHMGWLFVRKSAEAKQKGTEISMTDIYQDPVCVFQHKYYLQLAHLFCFGLPTLYGWMYYGSAVQGYLYLGVLRWILLLHSTWCVNSVAHKWGTRPYNPNIPPVESSITSVLAVGEGWHNYHHVYPYDYRASEFGWWTKWNPTSFVLDSLALVGLVWDRKRHIA